jgi:hypothetical protein
MRIPLETDAAGAAGSRDDAATAATTAHGERMDVETIDGFVAAIYDIISGDAGVPRDWERFRSLCHPASRLMPVTPRAEGGVTFESMSIDEYVASREVILRRESYYEREIARRADYFGHMASVVTLSESARTPDAPAYRRSVNLLHLLHDGHRWWLVSLMWDVSLAGDEEASLLEWLSHDDA